MASIEIDLLQFLTDQAQTPREKETSALRAHALTQWLLTHHFPSRIRKSDFPASVTSLHRGKIFIQVAEPKEGHVTNDELEVWRKNAFQALKKVKAEDLGNMNAAELQKSIPSKDAEGRGTEDLSALEKKLSVKVIFDSITGHVLLVGDEKKLEKKAFAIRNMLSHYHWRLSGTDVSFAKATSS